MYYIYRLYIYVYIYIYLSVLKLSSKAKFNKNVKGIALADEGDSLPKSCLVTGWGKTSDDNEYGSDVLMEVNVTLYEDKQCAESNWYCSEGINGPDRVRTFL